MSIPPWLDPDSQKIKKYFSIPVAFSSLILKQRAESQKDNPAIQGLQKSFKLPALFILS